MTYSLGYLQKKTSNVTLPLSFREIELLCFIFIDLFFSSYCHYELDDKATGFQCTIIMNKLTKLILSLIEGRQTQIIWKSIDPHFLFKFK